jgi:tight adherence protein B
MNRHITRTGVLFLATLLLGLFVAGGVATAQQQQKGLEVTYREQDSSPGRLKVTVALSGPAWGRGQQLSTDSFRASINGRPVTVAGATPLGAQQGNRGKLAVILAVDTSGSMRVNNNIETARRAAVRFAQELPSGTKLGVISFGTRPKLELGLTTDRARVLSVINGLEAETTGGTALYDAVIQGSKLLAKSSGQPNLVVLSDGRHEGTSTTLQQAISAAKGTVTITSVALEAGFLEAKDREALRAMVTATGGKTVSAQAENLEQVLQDVGNELASQYVVDLELPSGLGSTVDFRLRVAANGAVGEYHKADFALVGQASPATLPAAPAELPPVPGLSRLESPQGRYVIAIAGFTTVLLACLLLFGPGSRSARPYRALRQRLSPYSLTPAISDVQPRLTAFGSSEWAGRATAMAETLVRRGNLEETFLDRLEAAGLNMRVAEFVLISLGSAFIPPLLVLVITRNLLVAGIVVLLGTVGPFLYLSVRASRRQAKFEEQLPSTLQLLAGALQAGHSLQQAVDTVVHEAGDPIAGEFQRVLTEARLGRPLEEAFEAMAKRTNSLDFTWTVMAIRLQRQVGGNLAEVLGTVSQTIRDRYALRRQVKALSAEGRLSSLILSVLPLLMFLALLIFNPLFLQPLFTTGVGIMMMAGAAVLMLFGVFWLRKITQIKV